MTTTLRGLRERYRTSRWARAVYDPVMLVYYGLYLAARLLLALLEVPGSAWRASRLGRKDREWRARGGEWFSYQDRLYWLNADRTLHEIDGGLLYNLRQRARSAFAR